jgi:hypothetical protein
MEVEREEALEVEQEEVLEAVLVEVLEVAAAVSAPLVTAKGALQVKIAF